MAGGSGTRFWPISTKRRPKQLLNLDGTYPMIINTINRIIGVIPKDNILIVTNADQYDSLVETLDGMIDVDNILIEPVGRNTTACIGLAAEKIRSLNPSDSVMCVFPADHYIRDVEEFCSILKKCIDVAQNEDKLVTIGIAPTYPATGYGYIECTEDLNDFSEVLSFKEKPSHEIASDYLSKGNYLWNSGIFIWKTSVILNNISNFLPQIYHNLSLIFDAIGTENEVETINAIFPEIESISIDYGILEKSNDVLVIPGDFGWNDVGSWDSLSCIIEEDENNNINSGNNILINSSNNVLYSENVPIVMFGVDDCIAVQTDKAILICKKNDAQSISNLVKELSNSGFDELL